MAFTERSRPSASVRTPSHTNPVRGSTRVAAIQSAIRAASRTNPRRASRMAAGPFAAAFL